MMTIKELYEELEGWVASGLEDCEIKVCLINTSDEISIKGLSSNDDDSILYIDIE